MRHWHPGKIALIWIGVTILYFATRRTDAIALGIIAPFVAAILTWQWLSSREQLGRPRPEEAASGVPVGRSAPFRFSLPQLAGALVLFVRPIREREERVYSILDGVLPQSWAKVEGELLALRKFATEFAIKLALEHPSSNCEALLREFNRQFDDIAQTHLARPLALVNLRDRMAVYSRSMPADVSGLPEAVGRAFAEVCKSHEQVVIETGAEVFTVTFSTARNTIREMGPFT